MISLFSQCANLRLFKGSYRFVKSPILPFFYSPAINSSQHPNLISMYICTTTPLASTFHSKGVIDVPVKINQPTPTLLLPCLFLSTSRLNRCAYLSHYSFSFPFRGSWKYPCQLLLLCPWCPPPPSPSSSPSLPLLRSPVAPLRHNREIPKIEWSVSPVLKGCCLGNFSHNIIYPRCTGLFFFLNSIILKSKIIHHLIIYNL